MQKGGNLKKTLIHFILITVFLAGCGKNIVVDNSLLEVEKAWELTDLTNENAISCMAFYEGQLYYVQMYRDNFAVRALDLDGNETLRFEIPRGNGPGEARHSLGIVVNENGIYYSDFMLRRISKFDFEGNFIDSMEFNEDTGIVIEFEIMGEKMYTAAIDTVYIGKIDLATGEQTAAVPRKGKTLQEVGSTFSGGVVSCDPYNGEIYLGGLSAPYRIERYDKDLNKLGEYTYKLESEYKPAKINPGPSIAGDFTIASLAVTDEHIYAPHISSRIHVRNNTVERKPFTPEIFRFNKATGRMDHRYSVKDITEMIGRFTVIHADDDIIVAFILGSGEWVKNLYPENTPDAAQSIVILKK